jgi:hypothetical protein
MPRWGGGDAIVAELASQITDVRLDPLSQGLEFVLVSGCSYEECVTQLEWLQMVNAALGIDHEHTGSRVTVDTLCRQEGGGQLPLACAARRVVPRIVGDQRGASG